MTKEEQIARESTVVEFLSIVFTGRIVHDEGDDIDIGEAILHEAKRWKELRGGDVPLEFNRQALGEALTQYFGENACDPEVGEPDVFAMDPFDADNIDPIIDVIEATLKGKQP